MTGIKWNDGSSNGTCLLDFFDEVVNVNEAIVKLEDAAGESGGWDEDGWWGVHGTFKGESFTVYTHKSGILKIGGYSNAGGYSDGLDIKGLKVALLEVIAS
jgi:hypothetical protein